MLWTYERRVFGRASDRFSWAWVVRFSLTITNIHRVHLREEAGFLLGQNGGPGAVDAFQGVVSARDHRGFLYLIAS